MHALLHKAHESGKWITLPNGVHVLVGEGGKIAEGPKNLTGKPINNLPSSNKGSSPQAQSVPSSLPGKPAIPHDQAAILSKIHREANERDLNDAMRELQGVNVKSRNIPDSVGDQFDAHGTETLQNLTKLLNGGVDKNREFYSSPLSGAKAESGGYGVTVHGSSAFVVLGHPGKTIKEGGIGGVLVDPLHTPNIPDLQKAFPHVKFVAAADAAKILPKVTGPGGKPIKYGKSVAALRDSPIYRQKSFDESKHPRDDSGKFGEGSGSSSKPENKLVKDTPVKAAAQEVRNTHQAAQQARDQYAKARAAYEEALAAHREARSKHDEAKAERDERREAKEMAKEKVKEEKYSAREAKARAKINPADRPKAFDAVSASKGTATDEEKRRGASSDMSRIEDAAANLEKSGMSKQDADKLLGNLVKSGELDWIQTGQGVGKPYMTWVRISKSGKPANNLPK